MKHSLTHHSHESAQDEEKVQPPEPTEVYWSGRWASFNRAVDWPAREESAVPRFLRALERVTLMVERPINRLVRDPRFNPLYHTGTITVFLLLIIFITGIYLTMFFQFGLEQSYQAVAFMESSPVGRVMRALHRYASDLAMILLVLHAWRTFFMDRFRGPRWLAWVSGLVLAALVWVIGVTGYWMLADTRSQALTQTLIKAGSKTLLGASILVNNVVTEAAGSGWVLFLILFFVHFGLSLLIALFLWLHIKRLNRAKLMPPRYWSVVTFVLLVLASVLIPVGLLPPTDPLQLPGQITLDLWYLFYLPAALKMAPGPFWIVSGLILVMLASLPWLLAGRRKQPIVVHSDRCTGCTLCAEDCPYKALHMVEREDDSGYKFLAEVDPALCVSCGVCIGSCPTQALTLGEQPAEPLWWDVRLRVQQQKERPVKVVFACERHVFQGAASFIHPPGSEGAVDEQGMQVEVIPVTCISMAHPNLARQALDAGAAAVQFVGCPPEDCANREGNLWQALRLKRERPPKLRSADAQGPITSAWLPPDDFARSQKSELPQTIATTYDLDLGDIRWRSFVPALALLFVSLLIVAFLSHVPYRPFAQDQAMIEVALNHHSGYPLYTESTPSFSLSDIEPAPPSATHVKLEIDGQGVLDKRYEPRSENAPMLYAFEQFPLPAGKHTIRLIVQEEDDPLPQTFYDAETTLEAGQVLALHMRDARIAGGDPARGRKLYFETALGVNASCRICHSLEPDTTLVGPSFAGIATRAATRIPGMSAEAYLRQSILEPDAYVVQGFQPGMMPPNLAETLSKEEIDDLVAFLMSLQ